MRIITIKYIPNMEAEKTYQNKVPRTIQQKRGGDGALEFVDNRQGGILQVVAEPVQRLEDEDETLQGKFENAVQRQEDDDELMQGKFEQPVQRLGDEEDETLQGKFAQTVQREEDEELMQEKTIQTKAEVNRRYARMQGKHGGGNLHGHRKKLPKKVIKKQVQESKQEIEDRLLESSKWRNATPAQLKKENNTGLPNHLKAGIEDLSGFSMDDVRVHYNSDKPATVQALAYTQGTDIHVAPGQEQHLPHEAWHVAQQMAGRVEPTTEVGGLPVNDNMDLEHEADVMGAKANSY
mgnify:CR=1 FL=1